MRSRYRSACLITEEMWEYLLLYTTAVSMVTSERRAVEMVMSEQRAGRRARVFSAEEEIKVWDYFKSFSSTLCC